MNAVEFVRNQISEFGLDAGWEKAKAHIDYLISYGSEFGHVSKEEVEELEHLVKSWELVENFFNLNSLGFEKCIEIAKKQIEELESNGAIEFWHRWDDELSCTVERMKQAIADVESVGIAL